MPISSSLNNIMHKHRHGHIYDEVRTLSRKKKFVFFYHLSLYLFCFIVFLKIDIEVRIYEACGSICFLDIGNSVTMFSSGSNYKKVVWYRTLNFNLKKHEEYILHKSESSGFQLMRFFFAISLT